MDFKLTILLVLIVVKLNTTLGQDGFTACERSTVTCRCFTNENIHEVQYQVQMHSVEDNTTGIVECLPASDPIEICASFYGIVADFKKHGEIIPRLPELNSSQIEDCNNLTVVEERTSSVKKDLSMKLFRFVNFSNTERNSSQKQDCGNLTMVEERTSSVKKDLSMKLFRYVNFSSTGFPERHRVRRQEKPHEPCHVPKRVNGEVLCILWGTWTVCNISCLPEHGINLNGTVLKVKKVYCRKSVDIWMPYGLPQFPACHPFVNCAVEMVNPGSISCTESPGRPTVCEIACYETEDNKAVAKKKYVCKDETFARSLPHCAIVDDAPVAKRPK